MIGPFGVRRGLDWGGSCEGSGVSRRLAGAVVTLSPPDGCGRGVQEDQRVPPALEGGVMTPAGAPTIGT